MRTQLHAYDPHSFAASAPVAIQQVTRPVAGSMVGGGPRQVAGIQDHSGFSRVGHVVPRFTLAPGGGEERCLKRALQGTQCLDHLVQGAAQGVQVGQL